MQTHDKSSAPFDVEVSVYYLSLLSSDWFAGEVDHEHETGFLALSGPDGVHVRGTLVECLALLLFNFALVHQWLQVDYGHFLVQFHRLRVNQLVLVHVPPSPFQVQSVYIRTFLSRLAARLVRSQEEEFPRELVYADVQLAR